MKRIVYFFYYLKELDWRKYRRFVAYVQEKYHRSWPSIVLDSFAATFRYNISLLDYFYFRFYEKHHEERLTYAGTGYMYEYQRKMNPPGSRDILNDKIKFLETYNPYVKHKYVDIHSLQKNPSLAGAFLKKSKIVLKARDGQCGREVLVTESKNYDANKLIKLMDDEQFDLLEEYIHQHSAMNELSPSGLNTVRMITQIDKNGEAIILDCRLRISVNSFVDNLAAGNIAAPVDLETGRVVGPGVYSDITKNDERVHSITGTNIEGFQIPFWAETKELVLQAASINKANRSIGWDVAIYQNGPGLLEGNHNWCKLLWQLPVKKGLKSKLQKFL